MRSSRQKASISKLDLDQFVFTPPGPMGWQAHDSISAEKEEEEKHLDVGIIRELPHINAPKEYQKETKEKETDRKIVDDEEETKFETTLEPEEERDSKRSAPLYEEEDEDEEPDLAEEAKVEIIILPSESKPAPWFSQTVKRKA
ncbi:hypothetical protein [Bacillus subtilis]|uniref:hypothetical protein n=1 Tax=Bacillus subtilis TaxID=1423 RepID=UPI000D0309FF|nr:hypothetical protein [Bacillus subtilis]PRS93971.1 hypothetical protein C6350_15920 [Bacillus subtilis subsp. subtilis]PRS95024.1 hypothetical protein C6349_10805 [Bacillus subtilis subsp. subtilis]